MVLPLYWVLFLRFNTVGFVLAVLSPCRGLFLINREHIGESRVPPSPSPYWGLFFESLDEGVQIVIISPCRGLFTVEVVVNVVFEIFPLYGGLFCEHPGHVRFSRVVPLYRGLF